MSDWRSRAEVTSDVVLFRYVPEYLEAEVKEVFVWDLDKTYLDTPFESLRGLWRTIIESSFQKRNIPGTSTLVRALRNHWRNNNPQMRDFPIYFITASPPQMERRIHQKLNFDGLYPFGIFCKDNLKNIRPGQLSKLRHHVGYKLQALLQLRLHLHRDVRQVLWGDDSESDALVYSLYSDVCARRVQGADLRSLLRLQRVSPRQIDLILRLIDEVPENDPVEKIYINLAVDTDAEYYSKFGRRVVPTYDSFQTALDLCQDGRLSVEQVAMVAVDLLRHYNFTSQELERGIDDLVRRPLLAKESLEDILPVLRKEKIIDVNYRPSVEPKGIISRLGGRVIELEGNRDPWVPQQVDYTHDYR